MRALWFTLALLLLAVTGHGQEATPPAWDCWTGKAEDGSSNAKVSIDYEMEVAEAQLRYPRVTASTVEWIMPQSHIRATGQRLAVIGGKGLWRILYYDKIESQAEVVSAAVFLFETHRGLVRPFFVIFPEKELESFDSHLLSNETGPVKLIATTFMSGTGALFSSYEFSFRQGRPVFEGRYDGGRGLEEPERIR